MYKEFLKKRTKEAENKYKTYKNKLTRITRSNKNNYYSKLLEDNRSTIRNTWRVLNEIIKNKKNNTEIKDMTLAANYYFFGVCPGLAEELPKTGNGVLSKNVNISESMFVKGSDEKEIIEIVKTFKSKKSIDWNGIDIFMVKKYYWVCC